MSPAVVDGHKEQAVRSGRIASLLGMEGGHSTKGSLGVLRMMHRLGVRYLTLTHNDDVPWADHFDHLGVGGDYDGASRFPLGLEDVSGYPRLFDALRSRGWAEQDVAKVGTGNLLRAMREMEEAASVPA